MTDPESAPIFVVGTGRSGTTLLRMMLNAHPRIYVTHEASFYLTRAGKKASAAEWMEYYLKSFSFAWLGLGKGEVAAELARAPGPRRAAAVRAVMRAAARRHGKERFGDKTPMHCLHLARIYEDHPDARVIHIVRDPRDAVASLCRMPWAASSIGLNSLFCEQQVKAVHAFAGRVHEVRLEDLLARPRDVMAAVLAFAGEEWDDAVLDHQTRGPKDDVPPFPWFAAAAGNVKKRDGLPAYRRDLSPEWIRIVESMNRLSMSKYGYERASLDREPTFSSRTRARLADVGEALGTWRRLFAALRVWRGNGPLQEQMDALLGLNPGAWKHYPGFVVPAVPLPPA
ncbi:MAG: sulfotransferase [Acidobacteriota bacterium]